MVLGVGTISLLAGLVSIPREATTVDFSGFEVTEEVGDPVVAGVLSGIGVAGVVTGGVLLGLGIKRRKKLRNAPPSNAPPPEPTEAETQPTASVVPYGGRTGGGARVVVRF